MSSYSAVLQRLTGVALNRLGWPGSAHFLTLPTKTVTS